MIQIMQQAAPDVAKVCIPFDKSGNDLAVLAFPRIAELPPSDRAKSAAVLLWGHSRLFIPAGSPGALQQSASPDNAPNRRADCSQGTIRGPNSG
jgi:hypothetical protein